MGLINSHMAIGYKTLMIINTCFKVPLYDQVKILLENIDIALL